MKWASVLKYLPIEYDTTLAEIADRTERVSFDNNLNGNQIRIFLSNRYSKKELRIRKMTVGVEKDGEISHPVVITRNGAAEFILDPDETGFSDPAELKVHAGDRITVSLYLKDRQEIQSVCGYWASDGAKVTFNESGDATDGRKTEEHASEEIYAFVREDPGPVKGQFFYGFSAVQVLTDDAVKTVAAFGDSITHMSFVTNALQKRLYAAYPGKVTLINAGIGGNRLVHDATWIPEAPAEGRLFGQAGVSRFEKDVFGIDQVDTVLCLMGINDIMHPVQFEFAGESTDARYLEKGFRYIAEKAHAHGAKIFGATVMPCGNETYPKEWLPAFEKTRQALNAWIRTDHPYEGYFDYDAILKDETRPGYLKKDVHIGDGLHPNAKGGKMIAEGIDLEKLTGIAQRS